MSRTPEQVEADDALTRAIERVLEVYAGGVGNSWAMADYVVLTAQVGFDDDGAELLANGLISRDDSVPDYRVMGLLEHARVRIAKGVAEG